MSARIDTDDDADRRDVFGCLEAIEAGALKGVADRAARENHEGRA